MDIRSVENGSGSLSGEAVATIIVIVVCMYMLTRMGNRNIIRTNAESITPFSLDTIGKSILATLKLPLYPFHKFQSLPYILPVACGFSYICFVLVPMVHQDSGNFVRQIHCLGYGSILRHSVFSLKQLKPSSIAAFLLHPIYVSKGSATVWLVLVPLQCFLQISLLQFEIGSKHVVSSILQSWILQILAHLIILRSSTRFCIYGMDSFLYSLLTLVFLHNPRIDTSILNDASTALPLPFEARWHMLVLSFITYATKEAQDPTQFSNYQLISGILIGCLLWLEMPKNAQKCYRSMNYSVFKRIMYCFLLILCECFLPFTSIPYRSKSLLQSISSLAWWKAHFNSPLSINAVCELLEGSFIGYGISKLTKFLFPVLVLFANISMPNLFWTIECVDFTVAPVLHAITQQLYMCRETVPDAVINWLVAPVLIFQMMLAMTTTAWIYPNIGFAGILFLIYRFFQLSD